MILKWYFCTKCNYNFAIIGLYKNEILKLAEVSLNRNSPGPIFYSVLTNINLLLELWYYLSDAPLINSTGNDTILISIQDLGMLCSCILNFIFSLGKHNYIDTSYNQL